MSFWVLKAVSVSVKMPLANKTQMMLMNILMYDDVCFLDER